jgi:hypothetical protein
MPARHVDRCTDDYATSRPDTPDEPGIAARSAGYAKVRPANGSGHMEKIKIEQHSFSGSLWFAAWLFTIGFLHLTFWKGVLAIILWPYYLGLTFGR